MTTHSPQDWLNILQDCANEADRIANHYFNSRDIQITQKADNSPVTQADQEIETVIRKHILNSNPDIGVIGEEFDSCDPKTPIKLIIDPIDGTSNFIRNIPIYGTLLAIEVNNDIVAGVVSNGTQKDRWAAAKDCGATYNNTPIHVSSESDLSKSQAFFGSLYGREARGDTEKLLTLLSKTARQRGIGDFLMHMWVACGYGEFGIDFGLQPWDLGPLGIIVTEAGGTVTQLNSDTFSIYGQSIVSSNNQFHQRLLDHF